MFTNVTHYEQTIEDLDDIIEVLDQRIYELKSCRKACSIVSVALLHVLRIGAIVSKPVVKLFGLDRRKSLWISPLRFRRSLGFSKRSGIWTRK